MPRWTERLLVVGDGGTGRTTALRAWADDAQRNVDGSVAWIRGTSEHHATPNSAAATRASGDALDTIASADALAVDDAHWLADDVVVALAARADQIPVCATRATWPDTPALQHLDSALTIHHPANRLTMMTTDEVADAHRNADAEDLPVETLMRFTGGSPALVASCLEHRWSGEADDLPAAAIDLAVRLARQSGHDVVQIVQLMALGLSIDDATTAAASARVDVERRLRVSGLMTDNTIIPAVAVAFNRDLTRGDRETLAALISASAVVPSADVRAQIERASPEIIRRVAAAFRLGGSDTERLLAQLGTDGSDVQAIRFGVDMRSMRWVDAAESAPSPALRNLAAMFTTGRVSGGDGEHGIVDRLVDMIGAHAHGDDDAAATIGADAIERAEASDFDEPIGWSPAALASLTALGRGDARTARHWVRRALATNASGAGEQRCHRLIAAFAGIALNEFSEALDFVRGGPGEAWPRRDRFLLAAIDAAIARRSGDTTRLRTAWEQCEPLLVGHPTSWLLVDPLHDVLCAGARVGDARRVDPVLTQLRDQLDQLPERGPGATASLWVELHVSVSGDRWPDVTSAARSLSALSSSDRRSVARVAAAQAWLCIADVRAGGPPIDLSAVDRAVELLVEVDDAWEASRILGQAALDHDNSSVARSLLERARQLVTDPVETADGLLAAGLSEREAEVARLVAEGRTYKVIGSQLFISAKTVEHHVARIRQRLGASTRAEMLATIREMS